jgi:hypothetical protein
MKLAEIVATLESADESLCIVAKRPWAGDSEARLVAVDEDFQIPNEVLAAGYEYFLEVSVAIEDVLTGPVALSPEQRVAAVIYYAENDAYPAWLNELASGL